MLIGKPVDIPSSQITSRDKYLNRRRFLGGAVAAGAVALGADRVAEVVAPRIGALCRSKAGDRSKPSLPHRRTTLRPLEDRVYRHRCVEAWSMVIPWVGYSLSEFIRECMSRR